MLRALVVLLAATCVCGEEGLVAHYAFDEGEGVVAGDGSSVQRHADIQRAKWAKSAGRIALRFDGQGGHLHCGPGTRLGLRDTLTISAWVKPLRTPPLVPPEPTIIGDGPSTLAITYWRSRIHFYFAHWRHHLSTPALPGRWYHVVAVADGKEIALYLDGQRRTRRSLPEGTVIKGLGNFGIGGRPGGKNTFAGLVSDVRVYNRALSMDRIHATFPSSLRTLAQMPDSAWGSIDLPSGDGSVPDLDEVGVSHWQCHAGKVIDVLGIPFRLGVPLVSNARTRLDAKERTTVQLQRPARAAYLLMAVHLPRKEPGQRGKPYPLSYVSCPHRLLCELRLEDGTQEWAIPLDVALGEYRWSHGVWAYAFESAHGKKITGITLHDKLSTGALGVMAATASTQPISQRPSPQFPHYTVKPWQGTSAERALRPQQTCEASDVRSTDGVMSIRCDVSKGPPVWTALGIVPIRADSVMREANPRWDAAVEGQGSSEWEHETARLTDTGFEIASALTPSPERRVRAALSGEWVAPGELVLSFALTNTGQSAERVQKLIAPMLANVTFASQEDTWYWFSRAGGIINNRSISNRDPFGVWRPLQADGFFSPEWGWGIALTGRDTGGRFRYFTTKKDAGGCAYAQEYLPCILSPGQTKRTAPISIRAMPGDWKAQFIAYRDWLHTWWKPASPPKPWFRRVFSFVDYCPWAKTGDTGAQRRLQLPWWADRWTKMLGAIDMFYMYGWPCCPPLNDSHDGSYRYDGAGGKEGLRTKIAELQARGHRVGLYINGYLVHTRTEHPHLQRHFRAWQMRREDGLPMEDDWGKGPIAYMCPSQKGWREYLIDDVYRRIRRDLGVDLLYVDQYATGRRFCHSTEHGHGTPGSGLGLEMAMLKEIRAALPADVAVFTEYTPADVMAQYADGAYGHVAQYGREDIGHAYTPHLINLLRLAMPSFKNIKLTMWRPLKNGNWDYYKACLFNAESLYLGWNLIEHADAFTSDTVEPLVETLIPGVYANRFEGKDCTAWTFYNANPHSVDRVILSLPSESSVRYYDAYHDRPVKPTVRDGRHLVGPLVWPQDVGCLVRQHPK